MENFKGVLKKRISWLAVLNLVAVVFIVAGRMYSNEPSLGHVEGFIHGVQVGLVAAVLGVVIIRILKYRAAVQNETKLKQLYIEENDERTKLIRDKIGGVGFNFSLAAVALATAVAGYFDSTVFFTLLAVSFFLSMAKAGLKLYYSKTY